MRCEQHRFEVPRLRAIMIDVPPPPLVSHERHAARLTSPSRLAALRSTGLLSGHADVVLDRVARIATTLLGVPIALVSLVDDARQHFAGLHGLGGWAGDDRGTPLTHSFCQWVVTNDAPLLITDASQEPHTQHHPAHTDLGVVAYAGVPLRTAEGETLGAMCAINTVPVAWSAEQVAALEDLAAAAMAEIELRATVSALAAAHEQLRNQAMRDSLTGLLNRRGFADHAKQHLALAERSGSTFVVLALDLDGFKQINDTLGHDAGDEALMEMATLLTRLCRSSDLVGRLGGDEFVCLLTQTTAAEVGFVTARLHAELAARNANPDAEYQLMASIGWSEWSVAARATLPTLLRLADESMYGNKRARKLNTEHAA